MVGFIGRLALALTSRSIGDVPPTNLYFSNIYKVAAFRSIDPLGAVATLIIPLYSGDVVPPAHQTLPHQKP